MILSAIVKQNQVDALFINNPINLKAILKEGYSDFGIIIVTKTQIHCFIDIRDYDKCCRLVDKNICMHLFTKPNDLIDFLKTKKITSILLESNHLSIDDFDTYIKPLKIKTIKRINFNFIRMVKTDEELKYLQKSADIIADGINHIRKWIKYGVTEIATKQELYRYVMKHDGVTGMSFSTIVAFGKNTADIHGHASNKKLLKGEHILIDAGVIYNDYCSDITRCFWIDEPSEHIKAMYDCVLKANKLGIKFAKSNISGVELDGIARDYIKKNWNGYNIPHGVGHGVGRLVHEFPNVNPRYKEPLLDHTVVTIEPGIYEKGVGGIRIEDTVAIIKNKCVVLTKNSPK